MNTITQRLREIAKVLAEDAAARRGIGLDKAAELYSMAAELEAPATDPLPVAWIRWRSDGGYEGPLMHDQMEDVRKRSGAWTPLYRHPPTEVAALQEQINTAKPLDDPRLQELFGCAIDGALTIGYQGGAAAANGHWLKPWWGRGRAAAEREAALQERITSLEADLAHAHQAADLNSRDAQARINALEARQECDSGMAAIENALEGLVNRCNADSFLATDDAVIHAEAALERLYIARRLASSPPQPDTSKERQVPASASDEYTVVWPDGGRFIAGALKSAQDYMSGAILSCAARGVEPPVIVRYVPAEAVPYEPQQDSSKERP